MHTANKLFLKVYNAQEIKVDFRKKPHIFNSVFPSENLPCGFQDVKFVSDKKQQILQGKNMFTIGHTLPPFYKKTSTPVT